jgi:CubicO group peptidase (beta-lactamase class C family)
MRGRAIVVGIVGVAILAVLAVVLVPRLLQPKQASREVYWPTETWRTTTPEEQGLDSAKLAEGLLAMQERNIEIDSLLLIRDGAVLLDAHFYPYDGEAPHNLASVTKSVMTTLIGIAVDQGKLQLDQPMVSFFPERTVANLNERKEHITIRHLASMVNGFESGCLDGDEPTLDAMRAKEDWVQAALDRGMVREPGVVFCYDSPGMHLLSAILQQATGMTALDFARQNLFAPLGIHDVVWDSDPQGLSRGWGDLHLKPGDAAKIGYLWLNNGVWEGKQIVSASWVQDSVTAQSRSGGDDYGYGWWVSEGSYYAYGRGGQSVRVIPSLDAIVVTTGGGFDYDDIDPYLTAALVDPSKPLPPNPLAIGELEAALAAVGQATAPQPVGPLPVAVGAISGKTYVFGPNPAEVESLSLEFDGAAQGMLQFKRFGADEIVYWPIGLDGVYRQSAEGQYLRGSWSDAETFVFESFDASEVGRSTYRLRFRDDRLEVTSPEQTLVFEGALEAP